MTRAPRADLGAHAASWAAWQATPWGRLRYRVVAETLGRAVRALLVDGHGPRLHVLDAGGGDASDSVPLALAGHDVTVVDPSATLLARARERAAAAGTTIATVEGAIEDLEDLEDLADGRDVGGRGRFDLVLCHHVVQYLPGSEAAVAALAPLLRPGGRLSLMSVNPAGRVLATAVRLGDLTGALTQLDAPTMRAATFQTAVRAVEPEEGERSLASAGLAVEHAYGVLVLTTLLADDGRKDDPAVYSRLEALELALCDREPYHRTAAMWQRVARRPEPS